jgi:hypothetical protein
VSIVTGVTSALRLNASRLLLLGSVLVCLGGLGDIAYHGLPVAVAHSLEPLYGPEGIRAHILTLAGMMLALAGVMGRGLRR